VNQHIDCHAPVLGFYPLDQPLFDENWAFELAIFEMEMEENK
jgi:hypothetical protein